MEKHKSPFLFSPNTFVSCCAVVFLIYFVFISTAQAQPFSHADSLHGSLNPLRTCMDINRYDITLKVEPEKQFISGKNEITFTAVTSVKKIQLDLFAVMQIDSVVYQNKTLAFARDGNAFFVQFPAKIKAGKKVTLTVFFSGNPPVAKKAPWDGGFVWSKDANGLPYIGLACEGLGASCWLPCKDHLSDEAEQMTMHLQVPENLVGVSNGQLMGEKKLNNGFKEFTWQVTYPINNYNISVNIADYAHLHDEYISAKEGKLNLDYYVLKNFRDTAVKHFAQVKSMLACFEQHFGPYPFWHDGYKLVETPYWGMEHQSCIAYGNNYKNNNYGFDFIIIHESGHEWFGNSLSMNDAAELWLHESFTTYTETVYMECLYGKTKALQYLTAQRNNIKNTEPIIGHPGVYYHGYKDNDIYYKGAWVLHTMRTVINNDTTWFKLLLDLTNHFKRQQVTSALLIDFFNKHTQTNWTPFFTQYLRYPELPVFEYKITTEGAKTMLHYRLKAQAKDFALPVPIMLSGGHLTRLNATATWQTLAMDDLAPSDFKIDLSETLIAVQEIQ